MSRSVLTSLAYGVFAGFFAFSFALLLFHAKAPLYYPTGTFRLRYWVVEQLPAMAVDALPGCAAAVAAFVGSRFAAITGHPPHNLLAALFTAVAFPAVALIGTIAFAWRPFSGGLNLLGALLEDYKLLFLPALFAALLGTGLFVGFCGALGWGVKRSGRSVGP